MSVTADLTKRGRTLTENVKVTVPSAASVTTEARKPLYAGLGVVDLAVEQAREQVKTLPPAVQAQVKALPTTVRTLPTTVKAQLETLQDKGTALYGELVVRGEKLVTIIRKQPSTQLAEAQVEQTVRSAKGTVASAKKAAKTSAQAGEDAADKVG